MNLAPFNPEFLLQQVDHNQEMLREITSTFLKTYQEKIVELRQAVDRKDPVLLLESAHYLKGDLAIMGYPPAIAHAQILEDLGNSGKTDGAGPLVMELEQLVQPILDYIRSI